MPCSASDSSCRPLLAVGFLDPGQKALDPVRAYVGEPDSPYIREDHDDQRPVRGLRWSLRSGRRPIRYGAGASAGSRARPGGLRS